MKLKFSVNEVVINLEWYPYRSINHPMCEYTATSIGSLSNSMSSPGPVLKGCNFSTDSDLDRPPYTPQRNCALELKETKLIMPSTKEDSSNEKAAPA